MKPHSAYQFAIKIIEIIENAGYETRLAGGCVRDRLMGIEPKDYDLASSAPPEIILKLFQKKPFKAIATGLEHGTITVVYRLKTFEITTLRKDVATDGRHAQVAFGSSFEDDAQRRDFSINAMYEDKNGKIYDYNQGQEDIKSKKLQFVGNPSQRIEEDYLRILRFFRFKARLTFTSEEKTLLAIDKLKEGLIEISRERINQEIFELFSYSDIETSLRSMKEIQLFQYIFPKLPNSTNTTNGKMPIHKKDYPEKFLSNLHKVVNKKFLANARISTFFLLDSKLQNWNFFPTLGNLESILPIYKFSNSQKSMIIFCTFGLERLSCRTPWEQSECLDFIDECEKHGKGVFEEFFSPFWEAIFSLNEQYFANHRENLKTINSIEKTYGFLRTKEIPVDGNIIMKHFDIIEGEDLGKLLKLLRKKFRNGHWNNWEEAKIIIQNYIDSRAK